MARKGDLVGRDVELVGRVELRDRDGEVDDVLLRLVFAVKFGMRSKGRTLVHVSENEVVQVWV